MIMHEMGVVMNIVSGAERLARRYQVSAIGYVKVDIGGLSAVIPKYVRELWTLGTRDTILDGAELIINEVPGMVKCLDCGEEYELMNHRKDNMPDCPGCHGQRFSVMEGAREVLITELGIPE